MTRFVCPVCHATVTVYVPVTHPPVCTRHLKATVMEKQEEEAS